MTDISQLGEEGIIRLFDTGDRKEPVLMGIGDDCAVLRTGGIELLLWTTDLLVEDVHFKRSYITPGQLGMKSLAVNLSDIAAMGGSPTACLLGVSLPRDLDEEWIKGFRDGFQKMADQYDCPLIGGDTCGSKGAISIAVTAIGRVHVSEIMWRTGAREGDDIWVSSVTGLSELGLRMLREGTKEKSELKHEAIEAHLLPKPQIELGRELAQSGLANCCIDTSDGIAIDLGHICAMNQTGALIEEGLIPLPDIPPQRSEEALELAVYGGEDYGLLFTAGVEKRKILAGRGNLHRIGKIDSSLDGVYLMLKDGSSKNVTAPGQSFSHF